MNLNQVTLPALELEASVRFYRSLGLRLIVEDPPRYARFECPAGKSTLSVEVTGGNGAVVYFECEDLDGTVERLRAGGIAFDSLPADQPWLWREARLTDPSGNRLCLFSAGRNRRHPPWRIG